MADQTTSSILIAADPLSIMDVIADFSNYPLWAKGVKSCEVLTEYEDGRAGEGVGAGPASLAGLEASVGTMRNEDAK